MKSLHEAPLGKSTDYPQQYDASLLFPVPRQEKRQELGITPDALPFSGEDIWNAWELSWLNNKGKPVVAVGEFFVPAESPNLIESKSFKLYLNSLNQTRFSGIPEVVSVLEKDLSECAGGQVRVTVVPVSQADRGGQVQHFDGDCIDDLDVEIDQYQTNADLLKVESSDHVEETLVSHLLRSNCPVTGQPDWGSVIIRYQGKKLDREALLKYIVSFRQHTGFHEQCVEQIFMDLTALFSPEKLTVYARYLRRGGLDINPYRSNCNEGMENIRLVRQ